MIKLTKRTADSRVYEFSFDNVAELIAGDSIASGTVTITPSGLTQGSVSISGRSLFQRLSGGTNGQTYIALAKITTSNGSIIESKFSLKVDDTAH